ncbi:hypothetical protein PR202_ga14211 [Eleusine coracana subsp. coracana]|uniref:KIB1-4 beta-propeller domain-containing protein n=1 Tax=Eleusine coracana subsp. coracana TaxID=191504 RepID=A0AAV5CG70_ELECO|nr:hypothetical protein PR202_ga14211 [Eleusine coracana subsp. coracana]
MAMGFKEAEQHGGFKDVALWRGDLCALCHDGAVFVFRGNLGLRTVSVSQLRDPERALGMSRGSRWQLYLVDLEGALMLVRKRYESVDDEQVEWDVEVKVLASPEKRSWERVTEIPSHALFVGSVVSEAVPVAAYATSRIREGCVYFARREVEAVVPSAICEYSIEEDDMRYIPVAGGHNADVEPVWITPFM